VLTLEQKAAMIKGSTEVVLNAMKLPPGHDRKLSRSDGARARFRSTAVTLRAARSRGSSLQGRGGRSVREITARQSGRPSANFGDARAIAAEFAVISLARHCKRADIAALLVIVVVFVAMKGRVAWYAAMQLKISDNLRATGRLVMTIDRYAFLSSVVVGLGGWIYIWISAAFDPAYRQLRRFSLCSAAAAALVISVISDAVLAALELRGANLAAEFGTDPVDGDRTRMCRDSDFSHRRAWCCGQLPRRS
jgi:hypothetical protein